MAASKIFTDAEPVFKNSNWGLSMVESKIFSYKWDIKHFLQLAMKTGEVYQANTPTDGQSSTTWYLNVYPKGKDASFRDYVSVLVQSYHHRPLTTTVKTQFSIELRDSSNNVIVSRISEYAAFTQNSEQGFWDCIKRDALQKALEQSIDGTLTIVCVINEFTHITNIPGRPIQMQSHATNVLKSLQKDQTYTDFTINVKDRQFKVHKAVLHICSPVFAAMLSAEMKEREKNETTLNDVDPEVFEKVVEFMYTGSVATIDGDAMELVPVAHKCDLKALLEQCEAVLCSKGSVELAVKLLVLSNVYSLKYLKTATLNYIKANLNAISQTSDWKANVENDPKFLKLLLMG